MLWDINNFVEKALTHNNYPNSYELIMQKWSFMYNMNIEQSLLVALLDYRTLWNLRKITLKLFWQKIREDNVFSKEITK